MRGLKRWIGALTVSTLVFGTVGCIRPKDALPALYPAYSITDGEERWGYINEKGDYAIAPTYQWTDDFAADGLAIVEVGDHYGLIDRNGKTVAEPTYDVIGQPAADGTRVGSDGNRHKVLNRDGAAWFVSDEPVDSFSDGLALIARDSDAGTLYGYVSEDGSIAIEPKYAIAGRFTGGKAIVSPTEGSYAVIDASGAQTGALACAWAGDLAEDLFVYRDGETGSYGYAATTGSIVIPAQFASAQPFSAGYAVVEVVADRETYSPRYGLIDRQGQLVIPARYSSLSPVGGGLYAGGQAGESYVPEDFTLKTLVDRTGQELTPFSFYDVGRLSDGRISVTDFTSTFFIDATGARIDSLPVVQGTGELSVVGSIVRARVDSELRYVTKAGETVWKAADVLTLPGDITVRSAKYRPNRGILALYPELTTGLTDELRGSINAQLKAIFVDQGVATGVASSPADFTESVTVDYSAERLGNLLIVHRDGYVYPIGAAHGMPLNDFYHFDLSSGRLYALTDLFKKDSPYVERLQTPVARQMAADSEAYWFDPAPGIRPDQPFTVTDSGLIIYFYPYEIAPYAVGFPTFAIPWSDIQDIVDTQGAFWQALSAEAR